MTDTIIDNVLVTNNHNGIETFASDDNIQALVLRGVFTENVKIVSPQMGKKKIEMVTKAFREANQNNQIPDTTGFLPKEYEYTDIALELKDLLDYTANIYTTKHGLKSPRSTYSTRIHPNGLNHMGWNQGIMEASTIFMGERMHFLNSNADPKIGDLIIAKGFETIKQGNDRDDLARYEINPQSSRKTSMGISVLAHPNR